MMLKFYSYPNCDTCRRAKKWLTAKGVDFQEIDITRQPPTAAQLKQVLGAGHYALKDLFNTSGRVYRQMKLKDKLADMPQADATKLLVGHGKLCKRPMTTDGKSWTVGFKPEVFARFWDR